MSTKPGSKTGGLVYSTQHGKMCPGCRRPIPECVCGKVRPPPAQGETVRVHRETKGRKGKGVTVITGVPLAPADLVQFATQLKKKCGSGGTVKDGVIEIQGDHCDILMEELKKQGWPVKRSGG